MESKETHLAFTLAKTHYAVKSYLDSVLKESGSGLTPPESYLLGFIAENDEGNGVPFPVLKDIARASKGTVSECLSSLVRKGMIEGIVDKEDRRKKSFAILPLGKETVEEDRSRFAKAYETLSKGIGDEALESFVSVAEKLRYNALEGLE